jgi:ABC-type branched-subunit amino acid transport system substrate-binding protein
MRNQRRLRNAAVFATLALAGLGACGGRDDNTGTGGGSGGTADPDAELATGPGFDGETITVGMLGIETGAASAIGLPMAAGQKVYWEGVNAKGGVAGKYKVEAKSYDTKYSPTDTATLYQQSKGEVAMFSQIIGTASVNAVKDDLVQDRILGQPATLDAYWVHEEALMPFGTPYQVQAINGLDYAKNEIDGDDKRFCSLTKEDDYGLAGKAGYEAAVELLDITNTGLSLSFNTGDDMGPVIGQLQGDNCDVVLFTGISIDTGAVAQAAATRNYTPSWIALSASWVVTLAQTDGTPESAKTPLVPYYEENFYLVAEGGDWGATDIEGMANQMADIEAHAPDTVPSGYFTFGYNQAWAVHQVLEKAVELGDLSQEGILNASHEIEKLTFGGGYGEYGYGAPEDRKPSRQSTVFRIKGDKPNATEGTKINFVSDAAKEYEIPTS